MVIIMYLFICILFSVYQCEACLDLLVRAFNEVFSPVIETHDSRRENFHDVDELTNYYKRDKDGSIVLNDKMWLPPQLHWRRAKTRRRDMVGSLFKQLDFPSARSPPDEEVSSSSKSSNDSEKSVSIDAEIYPLVVDITDADDGTQYDDRPNAIDEHSDDYPEPSYHPRGRYVPGRRPLLDLIIQFLELFQVTAESSLIRPYVDDSYGRSAKNASNYYYER